MADYADRIFATSGPPGVDRGGRALGPREARGEPSEERRRRWRIEQVPATHTFADVNALLSDNGLSEVTFEGKAPAARVHGSPTPRKTWWARAAAPGDVTSFSCIQTTAGNDVEIIGYVESENRRSNKKSVAIAQGLPRRHT